MTNKDKVYQKTKTQLEDAIIRKLFALPAFKLNKKNAEVLEKYLLKYLSANISRNKSRKHTDLYNFRGGWKRLNTTLNILPKRIWLYLFLSFLFSIVSYFSIRQDYIVFELVGLISIFGFILAFYLFFLESYGVYNLVENTFNYLDRILKEIKKYTDNIFKQKVKINEQSIEYFSNKTVKEFIEQEIRNIEFNLKEIYLFPIIFAFLNSLMIVYVLGDRLVIITKDIVSFMKLIDSFPIIQNFNLQVFWIFCFSFSIALGRYLVIKLSQRYSNKLHQSLFIIDLNKNHLTE